MTTHQKTKWSEADTSLLIRMWAKEEAIADISKALNRREVVIRAKVSRLRATRADLVKQLSYRSKHPGGKKLTRRDIPKIRKDTRSLRLIGADYGVSAVTIYKVKTKETWRDV